MKTEKKTMTLDEVKAQLHPTKWVSATYEIEDQEVTFIMRKPKEQAMKMFADAHERKDIVNGAKNLIKMCLLSHTDEEFNKIVEENPELIGALSEDLTPLMTARRVEAKKD